MKVSSMCKSFWLYLFIPLFIFLASSARAQDSLPDHTTLLFDLVALDSFYNRLNIDVSKAGDLTLYSEVFKWYRTCYRYGGNSTSGIDCSHFVNMLYEKVTGSKLAGSSATIYQQCSKTDKKLDDAREGDLVFFRIRKNHVSHIGIYLQNGKFAHASTQAGVIISSLEEPYYKKYFYRIGRLDNNDKSVLVEH